MTENKWANWGEITLEELLHPIFFLVTSPWTWGKIQSSFHTFAAPAANVKSKPNSFNRNP